MQEQIELFYLDDAMVPCGAVVTTIGTDEIICRVAFSLPDGSGGGGEAIIAAAGSVTAWTTVRFRSGETTTMFSRADVELILGQTALDDPVLPSYGLSALVLELVDGPDEAVDLLLLDESGALPDAVSSARLVRAGTEDVHSPAQGLLHGCERVELTVAGRRTNTYWTREAVVVASDWAGARSYALPAAATAGLRTALG